MKYLIKNRVINSDHIVRVNYWPKNNNSVSQCHITLASVEPVTDVNGDTLGCSQSVTVTLKGETADLFWEAYIGDAYTVVNP